MALKTIKISGRSDDLIEVHGDFMDQGSGPGYVELSTGAVFHVVHENIGCWNVSQVRRGAGALQVEIIRKEQEDDDGYTGCAVIVGDVDWIDFWSAWPPKDYEVRERLEDRLDCLDGIQLMNAYRASHGR